MDTGTESRNCMQSSVWAMLYIEGVHQKLDQLLCEQLADFCLFSYPYKNRPAHMPSHRQNR